MRIRFRYILLGLGSAALIGGLLLTDPDGGSTTAIWLMYLGTGLLAVAAAHVALKGLHDYPEADRKRLFAKAAESPEGAGLALIALAIVLAAGMLTFSKAAHAQPGGAPHARAVALAPVLQAETARWWPELDRPHYVPALISHESCISYTHSRCWSPTSELRSQREQGLGLGQLTRSFRADGSVRFDSLADMRDRHPALRELDWNTLRGRPDLQIRAVVLMGRDNWQALRSVDDPVQRLAMADAAYNGGLGGLQRERRACAVADGCNPDRWFGHVEARCLKSRAALYGQRSACDINRHHVRDVLLVRMPWYRELMS